MSVLIADFDNQAKDPVFTGSLEQALNIAIEGASFITSFSRTTAQQIVRQLNSGAPLDEAAARLVAQREGIDVCPDRCDCAPRLGLYLDGQSRRSRNRQRAREGRTGRQRQGRSAEGRSERRLASCATTSATRPRRARSGRTEETVTAASLEALQSYSIAQDLSSSGRQEESIEHYRNAIRLDENFGRAYSGLATVALQHRAAARGSRALEAVPVVHGSNDRAGEIPHARTVVRGAGRQLRAGDRDTSRSSWRCIRPIARVRAIWGSLLSAC